MTALTTFEVELDDDGWWTVWVDGDHVGLFITEAEARRWVDDYHALERMDAGDWPW